MREMVQSMDRTVIMGLSPTTVTVAVSDPTPVALDWIIVSGAIIDDETGLPMGGASIDILLNGSLDTTVTTVADGSYAFDAQFYEGHYSLQARFNGDAGHDPDWSTLAFVDAWRPTTSLTIAVDPISAAPPIDVTISGRITRDDTDAGGSFPVDLYKNGIFMERKFADINGNHSFVDTITVVGVFTYYTKFEGNDKFQGCEGVILPCLNCRRPVDTRDKNEAACWFCGAVFEVVPIFG